MTCCLASGGPGSEPGSRAIGRVGVGSQARPARSHLEATVGLVDVASDDAAIKATDAG